MLIRRAAGEGPIMTLPPSPPGIRLTQERGRELSAWYLLSGSIRLCPGPEVEAIFDDLRDLRGDEFELVTTDTGPGAIPPTFRGGSEFTDELDGMQQSLGRHALEPVVFTGEYDNELRVNPIDPADWSPSSAGIPNLGIVR
jgi:hypothetical protein